MPFSTFLTRRTRNASAPAAGRRTWTFVGALVAVLIFGGAARPALASCPVFLENNGLSARFDPDTGGLAELTNRLTGERYKIVSSPFSMETGRGVIAAGQASSCRRTDDGIEFTYQFPGARATVAYRAPTGVDFLEKRLSVTNTGTVPLVIYRTVAEQLDFAPALRQLRPHYDPSQFRWLINVFLRGERGGFYAGVENPVSHFESKGHSPHDSWIELHYSPNATIAPNGLFLGDVSFLGAYRNEGIYLFKELAKLRNALSSPKAVPTALNLDQEILDWGEVWAMQDYMRRRQPAHDFETPGFYVRVVAMVGGSKSTAMGEAAGFHIPFGPQHVAGSKRFVHEIARLGHVPHVEWATEWFGNGGYANPTPGLELENAGPGEATPVNPYWADVVKYGWQKGLRAGIFETASRNFARRQEAWKVRNRDGSLWTWNPKAPLATNCWANPEYAAWRLEVTDRAIRDFKLYMVAWDAIVPADWSWLGWPVMKTECWATNHGHLPGDITYPLYRNIARFLEELQKRHPKVALRVASGLTTFYPWILTHLIEYHPNFYDGETGATYWTSYNFRFLPIYKSGVLLSGTTRPQFEWLLLRSISVSDHFMLWPDAVDIAMENRDFWNKWLNWADKNIEYLRVGRTLFREPWGDHMVASLPPALEGSLPAPDAAIHGTAHCIKDRGFLFLFNPSSGARVASIPINRWLGLSEGERFLVSELYPGSAQRGVYQRDAEMRLELAANSAVVLQIAPAIAENQKAAPAMNVALPVDKAFLRWEEIPWPEIEIRP